MGTHKIAGILKSLDPHTPEERELLGIVLGWAQKASLGVGYETISLVSTFTQEAQRYFHGLVEAVEIYSSLHGGKIPLVVLCGDQSVREIRQIRDLCLEDGLRSIY